MSESALPLLSDYLQQNIKERFGSAVTAAKELHLSYEALKKCLQRNAFNSDILNAFFPDITMGELRKLYNFNPTRRNRSSPSREGTSSKTPAERRDQTIDLMMDSIQELPMLSQLKFVAELLLRNGGDEADTSHNHELVLARRVVNGLISKATLTESSGPS